MASPGAPVAEMATAIQDIKAVFRSFDDDGKGIVIRDDLANVMRILEGGDWVDAHFDRMLETFGVSPGGQILYEPFVDWLFAGIEPGEPEDEEAEQSRCDDEVEESDEDRGFPTDCSGLLPDLSCHHSLVARVLTEEPGVYADLKEARTSLGVSVAQCIKAGIDNKGHKLIKSVGLTAGDALCYFAFRRVFDPVIALSHPCYTNGRAQSTELEPDRVVNTSMDPSGAYVSQVQIRASRNLAGLRFPPAASRQERREVERLFSRALIMLNGSLAGEYFPLRGSGTFIPKPNDMSKDEESSLRSAGLLLEEPDSAMLLSAGIGRHWPEARGVFVSFDQSFTASINSVDHVHFVCRHRSSDLKAAFSQLCTAQLTLEPELRRLGHEFARSESLGFLTTCPSLLGTAIHLTVTARLPLLNSRPEFKTLCRELGLVVKPSASKTLGGRDRYLDISLAGQLGSSAAEQANAIIEGCRQLVEREQQLKMEQAGPLVAAEAEQARPDVVSCDDGPGGAAVKLGGETMQLQVCGLSGNDLGTYAVSVTDTVADLLKRVSLEVPEGKMLTCVHDGLTLTATSVLSTSNVSTGAVLTVVMVDIQQKAAGKIGSFWRNKKGA